ncbi:unknown [Mycoplasma sp. CAG:956]|nr:unknown [Mycoplasma sp. CAG:956]
MFIELYKNDGKFITCYNDDAYILHSIFGYKLVGEGKNDKLGFPSTVIDKIIDKLDSLSINYEIYYKKELESSKDFKKKNNYQKYLDQGLLQVEIDKKVDLIKYKLSRLDLKDVNKELEKILDILK